MSIVNWGVCKYCKGPLSDTYELTVGWHFGCGSEAGVAELASAAASLLRTTDPVRESDGVFVDRAAKVIEAALNSYAGGKSAAALMAEIVLNAMADLDGVFSSDDVAGLNLVVRLLRGHYGGSGDFELRPASVGKEKYTWRKAAQRGVLQMMRSTQ